MYKTLLFFSLSISLFVAFSCKKNNETNTAGIHFAPMGAEISLYKNENSGIYANENQVSFFMPRGPEERTMSDQLFYNLNNSEVSIKHFNNVNPKKDIYRIVCVQKDYYVVRFRDSTKSNNLGGYIYFQEKLGLMDVNGFVYKELEVSKESLGYASALKVTPEGNILAGYYCETTASFYNELFYLDRNLNIIWKKKIEYGKNIIEDITLLNGNIYVLIVPTYDLTTKFFRIRKFDLLGNHKQFVTHTLPGAGVFSFLPSETDIKVFGYYYNAATSNIITAVTFDEQCSLKSYTDISEKSFFGGNDLIDFFYFDYFISNIIRQNDKYYFNLIVFDKTGNSKAMKSKFVRMSEDGKIEKSVILETNEIYTNSFRYLVKSGENFITLGSTTWNGLPGISFIKTDLDGNIIF